MFPLRLIVTSPHCSGTLRSGKECSGEDKRPYRLLRVSLLDSIVSGLVEGHSIKVVHITVLPSSMVKVVFRHSSLWPVKHRWLIHIIPDMDVVGSSLEFVEFEVALPPVLSLGVETVNPVRASRPAPSLIVITSLVLNCKSLINHVLDNWIVCLLLDVRIDNSNELF